MDHIPFVLQLLEYVTECDLSGHGVRHNMAPTDDSSSDSEADDNTDTNVVHTPIDTQGTNIVQNLKFESFRAKLITHFNIQYQKKAFVWPVAQ